MPRLLILLLIFALTLGNGVAVSAAICQHPDARAHAAALRSSDSAVVAVALNEDRAASIADEEGMLADGGAASLLGFVLPPEPGMPLRALERGNPPMAAMIRLAGRSSPPLLEPPLV